jgi:hypothetical protein
MRIWIAPRQGENIVSTSQKEQSDDEQFFNLIRSLGPDAVFKSYKHLCEYLQIEPTGGNTKKAIIAELTRYCIWKKEGNKFIITKIFASPLPKIDEKFLNSKYYPACGYLLLVFLAERYSQDENEKFCYMKKREIMGIISICNFNYSHLYYESSVDALDGDAESLYFTEIASNYLSNKINNILKSLKLRKLLNFDEVYMIKSDKGCECEATDEEERVIDKCYQYIIDKCCVKNKNAIRYSRYKKDIYKDINKLLGFKYYKSIKFYLTSDLASKAGYLREKRNLTKSCGAEVNSLVCNELYKLVFNGIVEHRENEIKQPAYKQPNMQLFIDNFDPDLVIEELDNQIARFEKEGVDITTNKIIRRWGFNLDDDIVNCGIQSLINAFIRINDGDGEIESDNKN